MLLNREDLFKAAKCISKHVDYVTCIHCCKFYIAPETSPCGHTLCHLCWKLHRCCPICSQNLDRKALTLNMQMKIITEHIRDVVEHFEKISGIKLDEIGLEIMDENAKDNQIKNVENWLASSQNHFSAPPFTETQQSTQNILPAVQITSNIQVHAATHRSKSPPTVIHRPQPQENWDAIEEVPESEYQADKDKENVVGPMDLEPFHFDDNDEYTPGNPRRSSRKKDVCDKSKSFNSKNKNISVDKQSSNNSTLDAERKTDKSKQHWTSVKKMRKEFSKLNKKNRSKLNVSIEMCKKAQSSLGKQKNVPAPEKSHENIFVIEEDTPVKDSSKDDSGEKMVTDKGNETMHNKKQESVNTLIKSVQKNTLADNDCIGIENDKPKNASQNTQIIFEPNEIHRVPNEDSSTKKVPFTKKANFNNDTAQTSNQVTVSQTNIPEDKPNNEDIHITIRIGTVVTHITINKKQNDVQLKVNSDQEVQASLGANALNECTNKVTEAKTHFMKDVSVSTKTMAPPQAKSSTAPVSAQLDTVKSVSTKKNTDSADTGTANYEITESVEKELSNAMICEENMEPKSQGSKKDKQTVETQKIIEDSQKSNKKNVLHDKDDDCLDDLDIFNSGSVKEHNVKSLNSAKGAPSEILMPTNKTTKSRTQKNSENKRLREENDISEMPGKRQKIDPVQISQNVLGDKIGLLDESEPNYDAVMDQVFANIDADMIEISSQKSQTKKDSGNRNIVQPSQNIKKAAEPLADAKFSENMFSTVGHIEIPPVAGPETQRHIDNLLTPGMCRDLAAPPTQHDDDSDKSVVEDTPQKSNSKLSTRNSGNKTVVSNNKLQLKPNPTSKKNSLNSQDNQSIINLTDSVNDHDSDKRETMVTLYKPKQTLETPLTINRFVDRIQHNSTPKVPARKSLNFTENEQLDDDITLCPTDNFKTTQEKQILSEVFANPTTPVRKPLASKNIIVSDKKFYIAGSCLTSGEIINLKILCKKRNWTYLEKYTAELTHLVVGVDDENKAQRSVKYMCALAASKWIVSYKWVEQCLQKNTIANEEEWEVLDSTGEAGPRRSRLASRKIFAGITFHCLPPFSVLDVHTLKDMLESAGGTVVDEISQIRVTGTSPALLLAEPANTQEDRFMYMAVDMRVVPVNYEWVLNCLGSYELNPLHDLLLCPMTLLPEATAQWPQQLMAVED